MQCAALLGSVGGIKVSKSFGRGTGRIGKGAQFKNRTSTRSRSTCAVPRGSLQLVSFFRLRFIAVAMVWLPDAKAQKEAGPIVLIANTREERL